MSSLRFDQLLEFDEGDVGLGGGIQIREPANLNPTSEEPPFASGTAECHQTFFKIGPSKMASVFLLIFLSIHQKGILKKDAVETLTKGSQSRMGTNII